MEGDELSPVARAGAADRRIATGTLLALLVVLLIAVAIPAVIAIARMGHPYDSNTTAAIATLRNLASCQDEFRARRAVDLDGDGEGEFGFFQEMTGAAGLRADATGATGATRGPVLTPVPLSPSLATVNARGAVSKAGYAFRVLLPGKGGAPVTEAGPIAVPRPVARGSGDAEAPPPPPTAPPFSGAIDTDAAERGWLGFAWPVASGSSGRRAFAVDAAGNIRACANGDDRFSGLAGTSEPTLASLPAGWCFGDPLPERWTGADGTEWSAVP